METWSIELISSLLPEVYAVIEKIDAREALELATLPGILKVTCLNVDEPEETEE